MVEGSSETGIGVVTSSIALRYLLSILKKPVAKVCPVLLLELPWMQAGTFQKYYMQYISHSAGACLTMCCCTWIVAELHATFLDLDLSVPLHM